MLSNVDLNYTVVSPFKKNIESNSNKAVPFGGRRPSEIARKQTPEAANRRQILRNIDVLFGEIYPIACGVAANEHGLTDPNIEKAGRKILKLYTNPTGEVPYFKWNVDKKDIIPSFEIMHKAIDEILQISTAEVEKLEEKALQAKNDLKAKKRIRLEDEQILRQYNFHNGRKNYIKVAKNIIDRAIYFCQID